MMRTMEYFKMHSNKQAQSSLTDTKLTDIFNISVVVLPVIFIIHYSSLLQQKKHLEVLKNSLCHTSTNHKKVTPLNLRRSH